MHSRIRAAASVLPDGRRGPTELEVVNGRLAAVRPLVDGGLPEWTLVPGFVDLQVNGIGAVDVARADGDDWRLLDRPLVAQGVTAWCPTLVSAPLTATPSRWPGSRRRPGGKVLGRRSSGRTSRAPSWATATALTPTACVAAPDLDWVGGPGSGRRG